MKMWHEARRQERKIRGMMVDYRRRAERRREFYEKIKADPTQFLQLHGRQYKIHLDPAVAAAADGPSTMMPWQGYTDNLIDRFDVRAHLDYISPVTKKPEPDELSYDERQINYERYRIIAQNSFLGINEDKFLKQLYLEEQFGYTEQPEVKKKKTGGAAIGFNYEDGTAVQPAVYNEENNSEDDNSDSDLDVDLYINVSKVDQCQAHEMNRHGLFFGMSSNDFYSFLTDDMEEAESNRLAREEEHEKALFSGRKSRRERRAHREKRLANRVISPPSYAARSSPTYPAFRDSKSASKSPSPENTGKITYITSFGGEDEAPSTSKLCADNRTKQNKNSLNSTSSREGEKRRIFSRSSRSSSRSRSSRRSRLSRRSSSRDRYRRRSPSCSRDRNKHHPLRRRRRESSSSSNSRSRSRSRSRSKEHIRRRPSSSSCSSSSSSSSSPKSKSGSRSPEPKRTASPSPSAVKMEVLPKTIPVQRYYGRRRSDHSSSSDEEEMKVDEDRGPAPPPVGSQQDSNDNVSGYGNAGPSSKFQKSVNTSMSSGLSLQERLKRKRQALLNRQFKADKLAEQMKTEREKQEQQNREDELREMAIKLRRRQREIRHAYNSSDSTSSDSDDSKSSDSQQSRHRRRSDSNSPKSASRSKASEQRNSRDISKERKSSRERKDTRDRDSRRGSRERRDGRERPDTRERSLERRDNRERSLDNRGRSGERRDVRERRSRSRSRNSNFWDQRRSSREDRSRGSTRSSDASENDHRRRYVEDEGRDRHSARQSYDSGRDRSNKGLVDY